MFMFYEMNLNLFTSCQAPKPGPYVKEMQDAATFYTNRVLKDYKDKSVKLPLLKPVFLIVRSRWAVQIQFGYKAAGISSTVCSYHFKLYHMFLFFLC